MDSHYTILLGEEEKGGCSNQRKGKSVSARFIISIVIPVVCVAILVGIAIILFPFVIIIVLLNFYLLTSM